MKTIIKIAEQLKYMNKILITLMIAISLFGILMQYSAAQSRSLHYAHKQLAIFLVFIPIYIAVSYVELQYIIRHAFIIYAISVALLLYLHFFGSSVMGAARWIKIGPYFNLQPSELTKITMILALSAYFHHLNKYQTHNSAYLIPPLLMIIIPVFMILRQPNLGTATIHTVIGGTILFVSGIRWRIIAICSSLTIGAVPAFWYMLHPYQKKRIITFLHPDEDLLGAGYNVMQSKIAIGSGGIHGKGWLKGTQNQLNFLPEKQTDFIFTVAAEELGLIGSITILITYALLIGTALYIGIRSKNMFAKCTAAGIATMWFLHVFINIAMTGGIVPVVGVPLPFMSHGGSMLITSMLSCALLNNLYINYVKYDKKQLTVS